MKKTLVHGAVVLLALGIAACHETTAPQLGPLARVDVVTGDAQTAAAGTQLAAPLVVKVSDAEGHPLPDKVVTFVVVSGGGSVIAPTAQTNAQGAAQNVWTLGTVVGEAQKVEIRAVDPATGAPTTYASFTATVTAGAPAQLQKLAGDAQTGSLAVPLADSLQVKVLDSYGNLVPNATVTWASPDGGVLSPASSVTRTDGTAKALWTTGTHVSAAATATVASLPALSFTATANVTAATNAVVTKVSGDAQTVAVGKFTAQPFTLSVKLPDGRPIVGVRAGWWTATGTGASGLSDGAGVVSMPMWFQETVGTKVLTGGVVCCGTNYGPVIGQSVPFTITLTPGAPASAVIQGKGSDGRLVTYGISDWMPGTAIRFNALPAGADLVPLDSLWVRVLDIGGNACVGATVNWASSSGAVRPSSSVVGADSMARTHFVAGLAITRVYASVGTLADTASVLPTTPVNVSLVVGTGTLTLTAGTSSDVVVQAKDQFQPADDVDSDYLTWTSSNSAVATVTTGAPGSPARATISAHAPGTATLTAAIGGITGTITVTVTP